MTNDVICIIVVLVIVVIAMCMNPCGGSKSGLTSPSGMSYPRHCAETPCAGYSIAKNTCDAAPNSILQWTPEQISACQFAAKYQKMCGACL